MSNKHFGSLKIDMNSVNFLNRSGYTDPLQNNSFQDNTEQLHYVVKTSSHKSFFSNYGTKERGLEENDART